MNSFNHYALGAIGEWLYRYVAGIDQEARSTGFRELVIAPRVGGKLTSIEASYDTPLGRASSAWSREGKEFKLAISVPPGAKARVTIPAAGADGATEGGRPLGDVPHISDVRVGVDEVSLTVPSGRYAFASTLPTRA
jgi:alpha-L-rhamnosidase